MRKAHRAQNRPAFVPAKERTSAAPMVHPATAKAKRAKERLTQCRGFRERTRNPRAKVRVVTTIDRASEAGNVLCPDLFKHKDGMGAAYGVCIS